MKRSRYTASPRARNDRAVDVEIQRYDGSTLEYAAAVLRTYYTYAIIVQRITLACGELAQWPTFLRLLPPSPSTVSFLRLEQRREIIIIVAARDQAGPAAGYSYPDRGDNSHDIAQWFSTRVTCDPWGDAKSSGILEEYKIWEFIVQWYRIDARLPSRIIATTPSEQRSVFFFLR